MHIRFGDPPAPVSAPLARQALTAWIRQVSGLAAQPLAGPGPASTPRHDAHPSPGSHHQMALLTIDTWPARDITLMPLDAHALVSDLSDGTAPTAARQAAAWLRDAGSLCTLAGLAGALDEVITGGSSCTGCTQ